MSITRRGLITGLVSLVAAPAVVRVDSLMRTWPVQPRRAPWTPYRHQIEMLEALEEYERFVVDTLRNVARGYGIPYERLVQMPARRFIASADPAPRSSPIVLAPRSIAVAWPDSSEDQQS